MSQESNNRQQQITRQQTRNNTNIGCSPGFRTHAVHRCAVQQEIGSCPSPGVAPRQVEGRIQGGERGWGTPFREPGLGFRGWGMPFREPGFREAGLIVLDFLGRNYACEFRV
jgi:hypothetical protein